MPSLGAPSLKPPGARRSPREPSRGRGRTRYSALLEATETLLLKHDPDSISLNSIANQAGIPVSSIYHFFPQKEAAFEALAIHHLTLLLDQLHAPIAARQLRNWTVLFRIDIDRARAFYAAHPAALKIFYGGFIGVDENKLNALSFDRIARANYARLNRIFHMPYMKDPLRFFEIRLGILESVWKTSFRRNRQITDEDHEDAFDACVAFSKKYIPPQLEPRAMLVEAQRRDDLLVLRFETEQSVTSP